MPSVSVGQELPPDLGGGEVSSTCFYYFLLYCICMYVLHICMCAMFDARRSQKRASDSLELELQVVVSHHVGAGN